MPKKLFLITLLLSTPVWCEPANEFTSEIYATAGTSSDIAARGAKCIEKNLTFKSVSRTSAPSNPAQSTMVVSPIRYSSGKVILETKPDSVIAQFRYPVSVGGAKHSIQSKLSLEAKDGRFRLRFFDTMALNLTQVSAAREFQVPRDGSRVETGANKVLDKVSDIISHCVQQHSSDAW